MMLPESDFLVKFSNSLKLNCLSLYDDAKTAHTLYLLTQRMLEVNEYMNLTAITDVDEIIVKHYVDSLTASAYIQAGSTVIDVGCGAGFPSLVLAICRQDIKITALDSTAKRINYIQETADMLDIDNISCIAARAEELALDAAHRERYDIACARAVARLNVLSELCIPFVKCGGKFIAMKANADEELAEASAAIKALGGTVLSTDKIVLKSASQEENPRCIISVRKASETPKIYPRNNSQIKKKPL